MELKIEYEKNKLVNVNNVFVNKIFSKKQNSSASDIMKMSDFIPEKWKTMVVGNLGHKYSHKSMIFVVTYKITYTQSLCT